MRRPILAFGVLSLVNAGLPALANPIDLGRETIRSILPEPRTESVPAYFGPAERAELDLRGGRYWRVLLETASESDAAAKVARAKAMLALGNTARVRETLAAVDGPAATRVLAEADTRDGDFASAIARLQPLLQADSTDALTRRQLGDVLEHVGDLEAAKAVYDGFREQDLLYQFRQNPDAFEDADELVAIARGLDRLATLSGSYRESPELHDELLAMFVRAYDIVDRGNPNAHVAAAEFLFARSDGKAAAEELQAALTANLRNRDALLLLGKMRLDSWDFENAAKVAAELRKLDFDSREADLIDARSLLLQRQPGRAMPFVQRVLDARPDDVEALGLLAAAHAARLEMDETAELLARVEELDPGNATAHFDVGKQLATQRQYDRAAEALREAVARAPWWMQPRNELGLLYTQSGEEQAAIVTLREAIRLDPFNAETRNYLGLLEELSTYASLPSEHFVFRHDDDGTTAAADGLTNELMADWLDPMHEDLAEIYGWAPEKPTEIQLFPTHDRFSVRIAGDPYVGTVGACTGPIIAMVAPRKEGETLGAYDAARVLRHEYTHTITLGATGNRIWHWMTEGLATREEQAPPRQGYLDLLTAATLGGELFPIEELTWGFVRPRKPTDRSQAYAQSWYVCEYIAERWGEEKLMEFMAASGRGLTEREGLDEVFGISPSEFDEAFGKWMTEQVTAWGRDRSSSIAYAAAVGEGDRAISSRDWPAAIAAYEKARQIRPLDEPPLRRLAGLYLVPDIDNKAKAAEMLMAVAIRSTDDYRFAARASRVYAELGETGKAVEAAWLAVRCAPADPAAHRILLAAAEAAGDEELAAKQRERIERLTTAVDAQ